MDDDSDSPDFGCPWLVPRDVPQLGPGEVHVWCATVHVDDATANRLLGILSSDEQQRAARYLLDRSRRRFIAGRAAQRMILAGYVASNVGWASAHLGDAGGLEPTLQAACDLVFDYSPLGKPALARDSDASGRLRFNISNSGDMALLAVAFDRDLGVDVERIRDNLDHAGLAKRYFAAEERDKLRGLPESQQLTGFFDCWTRKEAFLKAIGKGLTYPLDRAIVSVGSEPCRLLSLDGDQAAAAEWSLVAVHPAPGYVAAIALPGSEPHVEAFHWDWPNPP